MKRLAFVLLIVMIATLVVGPSAFAGGGNGAPSGEHYNLNIIGVDNPKNSDMTDSQRHTIFVPLDGKCNIELKQAPVGESFQVLDGNCFTGGNTTPDNIFLGARFQLPAPDPGLDGVLDYTVWARVPGNRGDAYALMTTCYYDTTLGDSYCSTDQTVTLNKNMDKFTNVSKQLLTVCTYTGTSWQTKPLFWDPALTYWWEYDNHGLRLAQLRFYPHVADTGSYVRTCSATSR